MIPIYKEKEILDAINQEGLVSEAWGYETPYCIWIFNDGMEKEEIWEKYHSPLNGFKPSLWDSGIIEDVTYFILEGYSGNLKRLSHKIENPLSEKIIFDD